MKARRLRAGQRLGRIIVSAPVDDSSPDPVYLVWHRGLLAPLACKAFASERRAHREAEVLSAMTHPNIVRCFGVAPPGLLLMEFLEGPTLSRLLRTAPRGRLSAGDALRVAIQIGAALVHMHERGYLHLDVKSANIIVSARRPVLCDLGTARTIRGARINEPTGTDEYMAPEQCKPGDVGCAADVFGLGVTLYRMLTGTFPFPASSRSRPYPQCVVPAVPLTQHLPRAPRALTALVQQCLARDPADRPALGTLLPALHGFIRRGARVWPQHAEPTAIASPINARPVRHATRR